MQLLSEGTSSQVTFLPECKLLTQNLAREVFLNFPPRQEVWSLMDLDVPTRAPSPLLPEPHSPHL